MKSGSLGAVPDDPAWQALAETARDPRRLLRESTRPLLGLSCSRVPVELPLALGFQPWRVRPVGGTPARATGLLQGFACSYLQDLLHQGLGDDLRPLRGLTLVASTCDSMRALPALWRASGAVPARLFSFRLPARPEGKAAREFLQAEVAAWRAWLEDLSGDRLHTGRLAEVAEVQNRVRAQLRQLAELMRAGSLPYSLLEMAASAAELLPGPRAVELLESAAQSATAARPARAGVRLALLGGLLALEPLLGWLEAHGGRVVDEDTCAVGRSFEPECDLDIERPLDDLAERLLRRPPCPVSVGSGERRLRDFREQAARLEVQGVLLLRYRGCECHGFDGVLLARGLEEMGLPHLMLELEPGEKISSQTATRLEAFLEMLSGVELP